MGKKRKKTKSSFNTNVEHSMFKGKGYAPYAAKPSTKPFHTKYTPQKKST